LLKKLGKDYGKGYSVTNLKYFRQLYLAYRNRTPQIGHAVCGRLPMPANENGHAMRDSFDPNLSWTHNRLLLKVENEHARSFYEIEAAKNQWSSRQLERQNPGRPESLLSRSFIKKQTRCTTAGMPASVNRNLNYSNPGISETV